jgi:hypothetical protein
MNQEPSKPVSRGLLVGLVIVLCLFFLWHFVLPMLSISHKSPIVSVLSNLRRVELAKELWAADHSATGGVQVSVQELAPYLGRSHDSNNLVRPVMGERYMINPLGVAPEAQLTRALGRWPSGTVVRLYPEGHPPSHLVLPEPRGGADQRQPSSRR